MSSPRAAALSGHAVHQGVVGKRRVPVQAGLLGHQLPGSPTASWRLSVGAGMGAARDQCSKRLLRGSRRSEKVRNGTTDERDRGNGIAIGFCHGSARLHGAARRATRGEPRQIGLALEATAHPIRRRQAHSEANWVVSSVTAPRCRHSVGAGSTAICAPWRNKIEVDAIQQAAIFAAQTCSLGLDCLTASMRAKRAFFVPCRSPSVRSLIRGTSANSTFPVRRTFRRRPGC